MAKAAKKSTKRTVAKKRKASTTRTKAKSQITVSHPSIPAPVASVLDDQNLRISLAPIVKTMMRRQRVNAGDGCISNPGGPSC